MSVNEYLPRQVDGAIERALAVMPIVVIDGPRATGKTTTAERVVASTLRFPNDLGLIQVRPAETLASLPKPVLIDEWQLADTDLLWTIKQIVDNNPTPGQFVLTGSVEPASYGPTYPLTGRAVQITMYPMTAAERQGRGDQPTLVERLVQGGSLDAGDSSPPVEISDLFVTGFPAARDQADPSLFLTSYAALVAQRAGDEGRDASRLARTLAVIGALTGQTVPDQRIWEAADINKATWKAYEDLLARTHLTPHLPAFTSNALSRLTHYPKRFLVDTALALALAEVSAADLERDLSLAGRYFESYAVQQLRTQAASLGGRLSHLRTGAGQQEVDVILDVGRRRFAFEVKGAPRPSIADAKHLVWLSEKLNDPIDLMAVLHPGSELYPLGDDLWAVPIGSL